MVAAALRRGLIAGLLAGLLAGLIASMIGEPPVQAAIDIEEANAPPDEGPPAFEVTRPAQRMGLIAGTALAGLAIGALFGVAWAWSAGRVAGDGWQRSLKLGAAAIGAFVLLPALKYPPNPPTVGDPATISTRTTLYLGLGFLGLLLALAAWAGARQLAGTRLPAPLRQTIVGVAVVAAAAVILLVLPAPASSGEIPADLLWSFRRASIGTAATLWGATAVVFGLLANRTT